MRPPKKAAEPKETLEAAKKPAPKKGAPAKEAPPRKVGTPEDVFADIVKLAGKERITARTLERLLQEDGKIETFTENHERLKTPDVKKYIEKMFNLCKPGWESEGFFLTTKESVFYVQGKRDKIALALDRYLQHLEIAAKRRDDEEEEMP